MNTAIVAKDLLLFRRETLVRGLLIAAACLVAVSALTGLQREQVFDKERSVALETDRSVWMNQGERNPHSAAHFARYAFRPVAPLALLDPGTSDFAGLAIWMEAHYQDPAVFRRSEDAGELTRYAQLTPAFLVQTVGPLIIFLMLFGSIAGEREDGTLRQLLATGVSAQGFFFGKLIAGLRLTLVAFSIIYIPVVLFALAVTPAEVDMDAVLRSFGLFVSYAAYLSIFVAIAIGTSALFKTRQAAFLALTCVWALVTIIIPRFAADVSTNVYPQPDPRAVSTELSAAAGAYRSDPERAKRIEQELLDQYGVDSTDDLPISYNAFVLQASEDLSEIEFDRFYDSLDAQYDRQESVMRGFSVLTPTLATDSLSRGFAGTDRIHQRSFSRAAENHRRVMIQRMNEDYMYNAGDRGAAYTANADLWQQFEEFEYRMPTFQRVAKHYLGDFVLLLGWLLAAIAVSFRMTGRAVRGEVQTV